MRVFRQVLPLVLLGLIMVASCAATPNPAGGDPGQPRPSMQAQLIIKFQKNVPDPSAAAFVAELTRASRLTLFYLRPLSGGAHLFRVENISDASQWSEGMEALSKRPDVLYVEEDRMMQHHQQ